MAVSPVLLMMQALGAAPAVTALVGNRIYAQVAPQEGTQPGGGVEPPHLVVRKIGQSEEHTLDGPSGLVDARVVVIGLATQFATTEAIWSAVADLIRGTFSGQVDGHAVTMFRDGIDASDFLSDRRLFRRALEVRMIIIDG